MRYQIKWSDLSLEEKLGEGQAGAVWSAKLLKSVDDLSEGTFLAVKRYKRWVLEQPGQYHRIMRELQAATTCIHPNLVRSFCLVTDPDNLPALVMQHYQGESLENWLGFDIHHKRTIPLKLALDLLAQICSGVGALHQAGFIHRDLKPANIMVDDDNHLTVMDLGVIALSESAESTTTHQFLGTIRYSAPEYLFGNKHHPAKQDYYSISAIAYELLVGNRYFDGVDQWAKLIWEKGPIYKDPQSSRYPGLNVARMELFQKEYGFRVALAVFFLYSALKNSHRNNDQTVALSSLSEVIASGRLMKEPFFVANNEIVFGIPKVLKLSRNLHSNPNSDDFYYTLEEARSELKALEIEDYDLLESAIAKWYWYHRLHGYLPSQEGDWDSWIRWQDLGLTEMEADQADPPTELPGSYEFDKAHYNWALHPTLLDMYRYKMLPTSEEMEWQPD